MANRSLMLSLYLSLALLPSFSFAFSFNFTSIPQQCQELSLAISGSGKPPYSVLIIPFGPSPLPNAVEARRIFEVQFNGTSTSASFLLNYPANSQFVAVVSAAVSFLSHHFFIPAIPHCERRCLQPGTHKTSGFPSFCLRPQLVTSSEALTI